MHYKFKIDIFSTYLYIFLPIYRYCVTIPLGSSRICQKKIIVKIVNIKIAFYKITLHF